MSRIRVMIADDEETVRDVLLSLLNTDEEISVVGAGQDADEAIAIAVSERPDVALLDVRMPARRGPARRPRDHPAEPGHRGHRALCRRRPEGRQHDAPSRRRRLSREG